MNATVHKFPNSGGEERRVPPPRPPVVLQEFNPEEGTELLEVARTALAGAETLLDFVHENRDLARNCGIETIAVELLAIMQGDRFSRVIDALEESARDGIPVELSPEGLATLRRVEALLAEAWSNLRKFTDGDFSAMEIAESRARREADYQKALLDLEERRMEDIRRELGNKQTSARRHSQNLAVLKAALGQAKANPNPVVVPAAMRSSELSIWIPFAIFGVIAVTVTVIAVVAGKK